jgi:putative NADH-flavin reductase
LVNQGFNIKVLARNPGKIEPTNPLIGVVKGNAREYDHIYSLLEGCDAVISTLGPARNEPDTCSIATGHIIRAMQALHMERYIEVAGLAIDTPEDKKGFQTRLIVKILKRFFPEPIGDRQKGYQMLERSNIRWTIVRCPRIKLTGASGRIRTSLTDCMGRKIGSTDLAQFLISQLTDEQYIRKAPFVSN